MTVAKPIGANSQNSESRWKFEVIRRTRLVTMLCSIGMLLPLASHPLAHSDGIFAWLLDLASHWQWLYLLGFIASVVLAATIDRRWIILLLGSPIPWLTASTPAPSQAQADEVFTVISANVHHTNTDTRPLAQWLAKEQPDAAVILEVSPEYAKNLQSLPGYPSQRIVAEHGPFGIAILSRHPLVKADVLRDSEGITHIEAQVQLPEQHVGLVAFHPMPPFSPRYHSARNIKLRTLAKKAKISALPTIIAGDINATPWSSAFSGLAEQGLRRASGLLPTWPAVLHGLFGIPIDHVLVTPHWKVVDTHRGPDLGPDHIPILVRLSLE